MTWVACEADIQRLDVIQEFQGTFSRIGASVVLACGPNQWYMSQDALRWPGVVGVLWSINVTVAVLNIEP
jgi:hypothetical protein